MIASLEPPPYETLIAAPTTITRSTADVGWADIGKTALLDLLRGLTGGAAAGTLAAKVGSVLAPDSAAAAAAARAQAAADQKKTIMIVAGVTGAVVLGVLLLRR
jgi:hypothetical protein